MRNVIFTALLVLGVSFSALAQEDVKYEYATVHIFRENDQFQLAVSYNNKYEVISVNCEDCKVAHNTAPALNWASENKWEIIQYQYNANGYASSFLLKRKKQ